MAKFEVERKKSEGPKRVKVEHCDPFQEAIIERMIADAMADGWQFRQAVINTPSYTRMLLIYVKG